MCTTIALCSSFARSKQGFTQSDVDPEWKIPRVQFTLSFVDFPLNWTLLCSLPPLQIPTGIVGDCEVSTKHGGPEQQKQENCPWRYKPGSKNLFGAMAARADEALGAAPEGSYVGGMLWYQVSSFFPVVLARYQAPPSLPRLWYVE